MSKQIAVNSNSQNDFNFHHFWHQNNNDNVAKSKVPVSKHLTNEAYWVSEPRFKIPDSPVFSIERNQKRRKQLCEFY